MYVVSSLVAGAGIDLMGNPVLVFVAGQIPAPKVDLRRVLMYLVRVRGVRVGGAPLRTRLSRSRVLGGAGTG